ncbi:acyl carrier protein [Streptomyces sp. NPDC093065]|uniref:acyl carrier protein n=1 Tax=Streptomyces sp. NPDC093065 TaxID=3366021 RepID=UPI003810DD5B
MPEQTSVLDLEDLRTTLAEILDIDVAQVTDTADFAEDLEVDSLMALEILVALEEKYQVTMVQENPQQIRSLSATYALLLEKLNSK